MFVRVRARYDSVYNAVAGQAAVLVGTPDALVTGSEHEVVLLSTILGGSLQFWKTLVRQTRLILGSKTKV